MSHTMSLSFPEEPPKPELTQRQFDRAIKEARKELELAGQELVDAETDGLLTVDEIDGKPVKMIGFGIPTGRFYAAQARLRAATARFAYIMQCPIKPARRRCQCSRWGEYAKYLASTLPDEE